MLSFLDGNKTYIVALSIVVGAVAAFVQGEVTLVEAVAGVLNGLGLGALRAGVAKGPQ